MKLILSLIYACLIVFLILLFSRCTIHARPEGGVPDAERFAYVVDPELLPAFESAADRIFEASGVRLTAVPEGTPIYAAGNTDGDCGQTIVSGYPDDAVITDAFVTVDAPAPAGCYEDLGDTILHELIHSLRRLEGLRDDGDDHSEAGIFTRKAHNPTLEETSLIKICEVAECTTFNPEAL